MKHLETAVFGGGCFWCTEAIFKQLRGVESVTPGYAGGGHKNPSYQQVSTGETGHAEVIKIEFDPKIIHYTELLDIFWNTHNPFSLNRQGNDVGTQYRSVIFYTTEEQKKIAEMTKNRMLFSGQYDKPIVTEIRPLAHFYDAESYHKDYYFNHADEPYCELVISPKLQHLKEKYGKMLKENE
jgi:peptide-methionine (S)-S-oxide reductase